MAPHEDVLHPGRGDEDVPFPGGLVHGQDPAAFEGRFQRGGGFDLGDDHVGSHPLGAHGAALPAVPVAGDHEILARQKHGGGPQDPVQARLARAVDVVEIPLGLGVVHRDHGIGELAVRGHGAQAMDPGGGLLGTAQDAFHEFGVVAVDPEDQVGAVIERQRGTEVEGAVDGPVELLHVLAVPGEDLDAVLGQGGGHRIVRAQGVAARPGDFRARGGQGLHQDGGLLGHVQASGDALSLERALLLEAVAQGHQDRHAAFGPVDEETPFLGKSGVGHLEGGRAGSRCFQVSIPDGVRSGGTRGRRAPGRGGF